MATHDSNWEPAFLTTVQRYEIRIGTIDDTPRGKLIRPIAHPAAQPTGSRPKLLNAIREDDRPIARNTVEILSVPAAMGVPRCGVQ